MTEQAGIHRPEPSHPCELQYLSPRVYNNYAKMKVKTEHSPENPGIPGLTPAPSSPGSDTAHGNHRVTVSGSAGERAHRPSYCTPIGQSPAVETSARHFPGNYRTDRLPGCAVARRTRCPRGANRARADDPHERLAHTPCRTQNHPYVTTVFPRPHKQRVTTGRALDPP